MNKVMRNIATPVFAALLVLFVLATVTGMVYAGQRNPTGGGHSYRVAEPAAIALLGAGLVSLGVYAKKKRSKKQ